MTQMQPRPASAADDLRSLRALRDELTRNVDDLRTWHDLLAHKAAALRNLTSAASSRLGAQGLTPGRLDLSVFAAAVSQPATPALRHERPAPRRVGAGIPGALSEVPTMLSLARELWDEVADPADPARALALALRAERHAANLQTRERQDRRRLWTTNREIAAALQHESAADSREDLDLLTGSLTDDGSRPWR